MRPECTDTLGSPPPRYLYWIAINGPTCARASLPLRSPMVSPTPYQLIGFPTEAEAAQAYHVCRTAPIPEVRRFMKSLASAVKAGTIRVIQPPHPEPPTKGATTWVDGDWLSGSQVERIALNETLICLGPALCRAFQDLGWAIPPLPSELVGLLQRHRAKWNDVHQGTGKIVTTRARALGRNGKPLEILTATRKDEEEGWLTLMCLATEWTDLTGEPAPSGQDS